MSRPTADMEQRALLFSEKYTELENGCWEWNASKTDNGYGIFWNGERTVVTHRWSYEYFVGEIPDGLELDHTCRKRDCVNPFHVEPVTHKVNGLRGISGLHRIKEARTITHCVNGHEFDEKNTGKGTNPNNMPYRVCRTCKREKRKQYYEKNAAEVNLRKRLARLQRNV